MRDHRPSSRAVVCVGTASHARSALWTATESLAKPYFRARTGTICLRWECPGSAKQEWLVHAALLASSTLRANWASCRARGEPRGYPRGPWAAPSRQEEWLLGRASALGRHAGRLGSAAGLARSEPATSAGLRSRAAPSASPRQSPAGTPARTNPGSRLGSGRYLQKNTALPSPPNAAMDCSARAAVSAWLGGGK